MFGTLGEHALEAELGSLHADVVAVDKARVAEHLRGLIEVLLNLLDLLLDIGSEALLVGQ